MSFVLEALMRVRPSRCSLWVCLMIQMEWQDEYVRRHHDMIVQAGAFEPQSMVDLTNARLLIIFFFFSIFKNPS